MQGLVGITSNPVLANGIAGLATSATAQATVEVRRFSESSCDFLLLRWLLRHLAKVVPACIIIPRTCIFCAVRCVVRLTVVL